MVEQKACFLQKQRDLCILQKLLLESVNPFQQFIGEFEQLEFAFDQVVANQEARVVLIAAMPARARREWYQPFGIVLLRSILMLIL